MKFFILIFLGFIMLFAKSPFDTPPPRQFDMSAFETKEGELNRQAKNNPKIKCRWVCDKKLYKEQKIAKAIEFYKKTR